MGIEGIGARVARKEDKRFITGAGRYVDDMVVPGMKHATFVRSPHAHADIKKIDTKKAAKAMPGVIGVLTGKQLKADGIGNLICGWMIHSKDGSPMKMGAWRRWRSTGALCRRRRRRGGRRHLGEARDAAEAVEIDYKERKRSPTRSRRLGKGAPQLHPEADGNLIFDWGSAMPQRPTALNPQLM
jgi:carbon-monoxide dehydrogenase large subunit